MCGSMVDIQSATAKNRRGGKEERSNYVGKKECPHVLRSAATNNIFLKILDAVSSVWLSNYQRKLQLNYWMQLFLLCMAACTDVNCGICDEDNCYACKTSFAFDSDDTCRGMTPAL